MSPYPAEHGLTRRRFDLTFRPGRIHPSVSGSVYHVSWMDEGDGLECCPWAETGGMVLWSVPEGSGGEGAGARLEVEHRP